MKNKKAFILASAFAFGLASPMALAGEWKNDYYAAPVSTAPVVLEKTTTVAPGLTQTTITAPVTIERGPGQAPVVIEDRIIKKKHMFGIGIWPLFDFEIL